MTEIQGPDWNIDIPADWEADQDEDYLILYDPDGVGALNLSGMVTDAEVTDADLREFAAEHLEAGAKIREVELGDFTGFTLNYREGDEYWQEWFLRSGPIALFVTYNCEYDDKGVEDEALEEILNSLRIA